MRLVTLASVLATVIAAGCIDQVDDASTATDEEAITSCPTVSISLAGLTSPATLDLSNYYALHSGCFGAMPVKVTAGTRVWDWTATWAGESLINNSTKCSHATVEADVRVPSANGEVALPYDHATSQGVPTGTLCIVPVARSTRTLGASTVPNPSGVYNFTLQASDNGTFSPLNYFGVKLKLTAR